MLKSVLDAYVQKTPLTVMARTMMERLLNPEQLDEWFEKTANVQYTRELLFSSVFDIMVQVVSGHQRSVHRAFQKNRERIGVSVTSLYNKLNGIEPRTSAELVRYAAGQAQALIEALGGARQPLVPGLRVKLLDGNSLAVTQHRLKELRSLASGPLPGKSLVVYDPSLRIPIDVFPCEDGHTQERALLEDVLPSVEKDDLWIADRNFCVRRFLFEIDAKGAYFIVRQHAKLPYSALGEEKACGSIETGEVFEQKITVTDESGEMRQFRRIRIRLHKPTRDKDRELAVIVNFSRRKIHPTQSALLYRGRWKIETAFQELTLYLNSEINTLGYPPAALFAFCVALVTYMIFGIMKAALSSVYGAEKIEQEFSSYHLACDLQEIYPGMMIVVSDDDWLAFRRYSQSEIVKFLKQLAKNTDLLQYKKKPRGPKKPTAKRVYDPKHPHVSTARILAARKRKV